MGDRRVVVTGLGAVTPLGITVGSYWDALLSGRSGIRTVQRFDATPYNARIGGECLDFNVAEFLDVRSARRLDRFAQLAFVAGKAAYEDAGLRDGQFDPTRAGVIVGTGIGGLSELEEQHKRLLAKGPSRVSAFTIPKLMANAGAGQLSISFNFQNVSAAVATACASAGNAMGEALNTIRNGYADIVMTGGSEAALTPLGLSAFAAMRALSTRNDDPAAASRPFDKDRDGFVLSEGAGMLVFEEFQHAKARGAQLLAELIGFGATSDACDMVQPDPEGTGAARAMRVALADARINPDEVDYINAHGTSTPLGDIAETKAVKTVFGAAARNVPISSTKSAVGHLLGASGGVESIAVIKALQNNALPPTLNLDNPDPECDLDYVPNTARDAKVRTAMSNSFGFGGHNACLIFRKL